MNVVHTLYKNNVKQKVKDEKIVFDRIKYSKKLKEEPVDAAFCA
jgi:hypothetical protein